MIQRELIERYIIIYLMKKKLLLSVAAGLLFASCSQDKSTEVRQNNEISFRHNLISTLRGAETTVSNLSGFYVATPDQPAYFPGNFATKKNSSANWIADNVPVRWRGDVLNVYAYGPATTVSDVIGSSDKRILTSSEKKIKGFEPARAIKDQKDLVVATNIGVTEASSQSGIIPLFFNHELAQIKIQAKSEYTNYKVEVAGVKLVHFNTTGDYTFPTTTSSDNVRGSWDNLSGIQETPSNTDSNVDGYYAHLKGSEISANPASVVILKSDPQSIILNGGDAGAFIIPQNITTDWKGNDVATDKGAQIAVLLRISKNTAANGTTEKWQQIYPDPTKNAANKGKFAYAAVGVKHNFEAGKIYTITLDILSSVAGAGRAPYNLNTPEVGNPTNDDTVSNNPGVESGKPIIGEKEIEFGVEIKSFDPVKNPIDVRM